MFLFAFAINFISLLLIFGLRRSEHISPVLISLHWLRIPERISFKLAVLTYRAIHGADRVISSPVSLASQTCRHDDDCVRPALIACTYRSFVDPQLAVAHSHLPAPRYGTTCRLTSRHSRSSDSALRHFCSRAHTLTLSVNLQTMYFFYTCVDLAITSLFRPL